MISPLKISTYNIGKNLSGLSETIMSVENTLKANKTNDKKRILSTLLMEECIVKLSQVAEENSNMKVMVRSGLRKTVITIYSKGGDIDFASIVSGTGTEILDEGYGYETGDAIRNLILKSYSQNIRYNRVRGWNSITILVQKSDNSAIFDVIMSIGLALLTGLILRGFFPENVLQALSDNLFNPMYSIFLNAIKMVMAPLVFFSLANCLGSFTNMRELGRSGAKVFGLYILTTLFAIAVAFGVKSCFTVKPLADLSMLNASTAQSTEQVSISFVDTIVNLMPSNIIAPFYNSDMLQIIVLAILIGIAAGSIGEYSVKIKEIVSSFDALFSRITALIIKLLPIAVYGSFTSMVLTMNLMTAKAVSSWVIMILLALTIMIVIYFILLYLLGKLNPLRFFRHYYKSYITAITTSSSNATMPVSMDCCEKMGISPMIYKFSIPLGATINMDGTSIFLVITTMFLASLCGITIPTSIMATFIATVVLMSMASPAVPGAGFACLTMLLGIVGVPQESFALLIGIFPLFDPLFTASNVIGDGIVTTIVAKSENALNIKAFNGENNN